uniref:Uncharacterized protein n=1 Tax=Cacopsylla melanoneura TaxID=428564 RepID=A0A8D8ZPT8_9HEMI
MNPKESRVKSVHLVQFAGSLRNFGVFEFPSPIIIRNEVNFVVEFLAKISHIVRVWKHAGNTGDANLITGVRHSEATARFESQLLAGQLHGGSCFGRHVAGSRYLVFER